MSQPRQITTNDLARLAKQADDYDQVLIHSDNELKPLLAHIAALEKALDRIGSGNTHYPAKPSLDARNVMTLDGPLSIPAGPCVCRWCTAWRTRHATEPPTKDTA